MYLYLYIQIHKCSTVLSLAHRLRDHESASETKASVHKELKVARCNTCDCQQAASNKHTPFQSGVCVCLFRACAEDFGFHIGQVRLGVSVRNYFSVRTILNSTGYCKLPR